jgi:protein subunit release factor A
MIERLIEQIEARGAELERLMADPEVIADRERFAEIGREYRDLEQARGLAREYRQAVDDLEGARELLEEDGDDPELRKLVVDSPARIEDLGERIRVAMVERDPNDLQIDVYRSSGPGGQSVNTTDSAVRITHKPSGIVVSMQDEKSQLQNRERAMRVLRARIYERALREQQAELAADRRAQVGSGERSEKVRTYNFPQGRVTDHRIKLTTHNLQEVLEGGLNEFTDALVADERRRKLEAQAV